jgi:hypothetical protein
MTTAESDPKLFQLLTVGVLLVRTTEFEAWYQSERNKGKWPSQRLKSKLKIGRGRPTKQTEAARNSVIGLVRDGKWCGKMGVTELRRLLIDSGRDGIPSTDTLRRMVDQLHRETGVPALFRKAPARRKRLKNAGLK